MTTYAPASHFCLQCDRMGIIMNGICRSCDYENRNPPAGMIAMCSCGHKAHNLACPRCGHTEHNFDGFSDAKRYAELESMWDWMGWHRA